MRDFENRVESLIESMQDSNVQLVQGQLLSIFKETESDDEKRSECAKWAFAKTNKLTDDRHSMVLLAAALEVNWPPYERGDGYWAEPEDLATAATLIGINNESQTLIDFTLRLAACEAISFFDLGTAANPGSSAEQILFAVKRTPLDPVRAMVAVSPELGETERLQTLKQIDDFEWLVDAITQSDGWRWPDWQRAFASASLNYEPSVGLWGILFEELFNQLLDESSQLPWIVDFFVEFENCGGLDTDHSPNLNLDFIRSHENLKLMALLSGWQPLVEAMEEH